MTGTMTPAASTVGAPSAATRTPTATTATRTTSRRIVRPPEVVDDDVARVVQPGRAGRIELLQRLARQRAAVAVGARVDREVGPARRELSGGPPVHEQVPERCFANRVDRFRGGLRG